MWIGLQYLFLNFEYTFKYFLAYKGYKDRRTNHNIPYLLQSKWHFNYCC